MSREKTVELIKKLNEKTTAGELGWQESERPDVFQASFARYSVRIGYSQIAGDEDYWLAIANLSGDVIESVTSSELSLSGEMQGAYMTMREIYNLARRQVFGVDGAIDDILRSM